jgi:hypothetical protein
LYVSDNRSIQWGAVFAAGTKSRQAGTEAVKLKVIVSFVIPGYEALYTTILIYRLIGMPVEGPEALFPYKVFNIHIRIAMCYAKVNFRLGIVLRPGSYFDSMPGQIIHQVIYLLYSRIFIGQPYYFQWLYGTGTAVNVIFLRIHTGIYFVSLWCCLVSSCQKS